MKKLLLSMLACGSFAAAQAQGVLVYGNVGYNSGKDGEERSLLGVANSSADEEWKTRSWNVSPGIGIMINENWTVGAQVGYFKTSDIYSYDSTGVDYESTTSSSTLQVGPFVRYTKHIGSSPFFTYAQLDAFYQFRKDRTEIDDNIGTNSEFDTEWNGLGGRLYPAVGIKIKPCMALAINFGGLEYSRMKQTEENKPTGFDEYDVSRTDLDFQFGQQMNLTVQWMFGGKKRPGGYRQPMDDTRSMDVSDDQDEDDNSRRNRRNRRNNDME